MSRHSFATSLATLALLALGALAACQEQTTQDPAAGEPALDGKGDGATTCALTGSWLASGDWPSFGMWYFKLDKGKLVVSETDDLGADDWPTHLLRDDFDPSAVTLMQITRGGDMIFQTTLNLAITGCKNGKAQLGVSEAYTVSIDLAEDGDSVERHEVELEAGAAIER